MSPFLSLIPRSFARTALLLSLLVLACTALLQAQSVTWTPAGGKLPTGLISELALVFENCEPKGDPAPPKVPGLMLALRGSSQSISIVNFTKTATITFAFAARLEKKQAIEIPSFTVETDKGTLTVEAVKFEPGEAAIGQGNVSVEDIAQAKFLFPSDTVWAGEVFTLSYRLDVLRRYYHQIASNPEWDPAPLVTEEWGKPELAEGRSKNEALLNILYRTRGYARDPGAIQFNQAQQLVNIRTGSSGGFGIFASQPELQQLAVASDQPRMSVKPLPAPAPSSFAGAVGQYKLASRIVPKEAKVGEPLTWTLELSGTGNWPAITQLPARSVPKSFEIIQPQARRNLTEGKLFDGSLSEDLVMIPRNPGTYTIPPINFSYFDPKTGAYRTLSTESVKITVNAAPSSSLANGDNTSRSGETKQGGPSTDNTGATGAFPGTPQAPAPIPGDPLDTQTLASRPLSEGALLILVLLPVACLPLIWLIFAVLRALDRDAATPRRAALARLRRLLAKAPAGDQATRSLLREWQQECARVAGLASTAPALQGLSRSIPAAEAGQLAKLWQDADALLYGRSTSLPKDWLANARSLAARQTAPSFPMATILRHLLPLILVSTVLIQVATPAQAAEAMKARANDEAASAYSAGNYAEAARLWSLDLNAEPLRWPARHNLGLAYLQHNQSGAAMAELAAAFVQNPADERVRRNFRLACTQAGVSPEVIGELSGEGPLPFLVRQAPLRCWQYALPCASLLLALGLVVLVARAYKRRFPLQAVFAGTLLTTGTLLAILALSVLYRYGPVRSNASALVWQNTTLRSIPTEADATQKTSAITTGTLVLIDKEFLGWRHVTLTNGEGGWLRSGDLVMIWR